MKKLIFICNICFLVLTLTYATYAKGYRVCKVYQYEGLDSVHKKLVIIKHFDQNGRVSYMEIGKDYEGDIDEDIDCPVTANNRYYYTYNDTFLQKRMIVCDREMLNTDERTFIGGDTILSRYSYGLDKRGRINFLARKDSVYETNKPHSWDCTDCDTKPDSFWKEWQKGLENTSIIAYDERTGDIANRIEIDSVFKRFRITKNEFAFYGDGSGYKLASVYSKGDSLPVHNLDRYPVNYKVNYYYNYDTVTSIGYHPGSEERIPPYELFIRRDVHVSVLEFEKGIPRVTWEKYIEYKAPGEAKEEVRCLEYGTENRVKKITTYESENKINITYLFVYE